MNEPHPIRVLYVEDDRAQARIVQAKLQCSGYTVDLAYDGEQGLRMLAAGRYHVLVVDQSLPGRNGLEVIRTLASQGTLPPTIMVTGTGDETIAVEAMKLGAGDYIVKSMAGGFVSYLPAVIERVLEKERFLRKEAEAETIRRQNEAKFRAFADAAQDGVVMIDDQDKIVFWNDAAGRMFGYEESEVLGKDAHQMLAAPRYRAQHRNAFPDFQRTGEGPAIGKTVELHGIRKSGHEFPIEISLSPFQLADKWHAVSIIRDITERKRQEAAITASEEKYRTLFELSTDAIMTLSPQDGFLAGNPAAVKMFRCKDHHHFTSLSPADLSPEYQPDGSLSSVKARQMMGIAMREGRHFFEWIHQRIGGHDFPATVSLARMNLGGKPILQATVRDVTRQKAAERKLREQSCALNDRVKELNCLYGISRILEEEDVRIEQVARKTLAFVCRAWRYPEITCARIVFDGEVFQTDNFRETHWKQSAPLRVDDRLVGALEVCYLEKKWADNDDPFQTEERALIGEIAERLQNVIQRRRAEKNVRNSRAFLQTVIDSFPDPLTVIGRDRRVVLANRAARNATPAKDMLAGRLTCRQTCSGSECPSMGNKTECLLEQVCATKAPVTLEHVYRDAQGKAIHLEISAAPVFDDRGEVVQIIRSCRDITERKRMEAKLVRAQKLESIGQLAAGIAHEINTPAQYIGDNIRFLEGAFEDMDQVLETLTRLLQAAKDHKSTEELVRQAEAALGEADIDYLREETPNAIRQSIEGVDKVAEIVRAMKEFSHPARGHKQTVDLNRAIQSTLIVSRNEWKYVADLVTDLDPNMPPVSCFLGEFNQALLNLITNAAHAIADVVGDGSRGKGTIVVSSRYDRDWAEIRVKDTGTGIPEEIRSRVFDHFFTTKEVGQGTGQGLSIVHSIVTKKHGGTITFETESGRGTTFIVRIPVAECVASEQGGRAGIAQLGSNTQ